MANRDASYLEASLDGYILEIQDIEDSFEKAIDVKEIPYRDGALTDDLGLKARRIRFRCYFYGDRYETHRNFLNHLASRDLFELIHPHYGLVKGRIDTVSARHDDRWQTAEIDVGFVEHLREALDFAHRRIDVRGEAQDAYEQGIGEQMEAFASSAQAALGAEGASICSKALTAGQSAFSQLTKLSLAAQAWVKRIDAVVAGLESTLTEISNPANSLVSSIDFGLTLPGRAIGAIARTAERYSILYDSLKSSPEKFLANLEDAMTDLGNQLGFEDEARHTTALQASVDLADVYAADEDRRDQARALEQAASFDAMGDFLKPASTPELLTVSQIEQSLAAANSMIQDAVALDRSCQALKDLARILTEHAVQQKLESGNLVSLTVPDCIPLHLLCLQRGLPYNYAERIWTANRMSNPNFVHGEVMVYVQ